LITRIPNDNFIINTQLNLAANQHYLQVRNLVRIECQCVQNTKIYNIITIPIFYIMIQFFFHNNILPDQPYMDVVVS